MTTFLPQPPKNGMPGCTCIPYAVLGDMDKWNDAEHQLALAEPRTSDPEVQRCAADALGLHPTLDNLRPLLDLREKAPTADTHLVYVVRLAIRDHCKVPGMLPQLAKTDLSTDDVRAIMDIAPGVDTAESANFLIDHLDSVGADPQTIAKYVRSAVAKIEPDHLDAAVQTIRKHFADDVDMQLEMLDSLKEGVMQRGGTLSPTTIAWGTELAQQIFSEKADPNTPWTNHSLETATVTGNPWTLQQRSSDGGDHTSWFLSTSLNEPMTGRLTSKTFDIPPTLSFYLAGHNGNPSTNPPPVNFFRLRDAETNQGLQHSRRRELGQESDMGFERCRWKEGIPGSG